MNTQVSDIGYEPRTRHGWFYSGAVAIAVSTALVTGCFSGGGGGSSGGTVTTLDDPNPPVTIAGTSLYCDHTIQTSDTAASYVNDAPDSIPTFIVSKETAGRTGDQPSELRANAGNTITRLSAVVDPMLPGDPDTDGSSPTLIPLDQWDGEPQVHPILVSYTEQVYCDPVDLWGGQTCYEMGDGSADIADPNHIDDAYVSLSLDNGRSWKKERVGDTAMVNNTTVQSSIQVTWDGETIDYPGHSHKMTMATQGNNILTAWLDKYCPSGNPYDLEQLEDGSYPDDLYQVNGTQGTVEYDLPCDITDPEDLNYNCAPNGKPVFEVPYSCIWAARGTFDPETGIIEWRQMEQLTSGRRDANKIWIAAQDIGFAMAWQEDPEGLREGKGEGPGVGWSGATTNHGSDIWYSYITMDEFDDILVDVNDTPSDTSDDQVIEEPTAADYDQLAAKAKPAVKFTYPVRVTDNEVCSPDDSESKLYCAGVCTDSTTVEANNQSGDTINRCITGDHDPLEEDETIYTTLDGDTGASRPTLTILKTMDDAGNVAEYLTVLAYEETKGLSETEPGVPDDPTAIDIAVEGKIVLAEVFLWNEPVTISAGNAVNVRVPRCDVATGTLDTNDMIFENARRVVLVKQVDPCEMTASSYPIGFLYKQSFDTQGGPSDMYIRMFRVLSSDTFEDAIYNVSSQSVVNVDPENPQVDVEDLEWTPDNLDDYVCENPYDNTFSPRAFMRGDEIYTGYAYTPDDARTVNLGVAGNVASNFWIHRNLTGAPDGWLGPQQITFEQGGTTALDPRFVPTAKFADTGLASDKSNPDVLMMTYGTANEEHELGVYYSRSVDKGETWEYVTINDGGTPDDTTDDQVRFAKLSDWALPVEEGSAQLTASPDGNMGFNIWLQESEVSPADPGVLVDDAGDATFIYEGEEVSVPARVLGLETWMGRVDWAPEVVE